MRRMASPSNGAIGKTVILSDFFSSLTGTVSVTTTSFTGQAVILWIAAPENIG